MTTEQAAALVARAQAGEAQAFAELYEAYAPLIYRFLRGRMTVSDEVIEDLTEDVFVRVFQRLGSYVDRGAPFSAWLYRVARNQMIDYLRSAPRRATLPLDDMTEAQTPRVDADYGQSLDRMTLKPAVARLTADQRQVIELRFFEGMSTAQTAAAMGRSEDAVKKLQARALVNLRRLLGPARTATQTPRVVLAA
jgi:RNA polymerase sigma-70 factor (ECF subfamily)